MLDSTVAMKVLLPLLMLFQTSPVITSPQMGETLRGQVNIVGNMDVPNFASAELAFGYASDPTQTWFVIQTFSAPTLESVWDTTPITDGDYNLRLRVFLLDGSIQEAIISDLKIRNDIPPQTETPTLQPVSVIETALPSPTSVLSAVKQAFPSPTPLPANPASLMIPSIQSNFVRGALLVLGLFIVLGIFLRLRKNA